MATFSSCAWSWRLQRAIRKSNGLLVQFAMDVCKVVSYNDPHYQYHELQSFHFVFMSDFCYWFHFSLYSLRVRIEALRDSVMRQPFKSTNIMDGLLFLSMVRDADKISDYFISLPV